MGLEKIIQLDSTLTTTQTTTTIGELRTKLHMVNQHMGHKHRRTQESLLSAMDYQPQEYLNLLQKKYAPTTCETKVATIFKMTKTLLPEETLLHLKWKSALLQAKRETNLAGPTWYPEQGSSKVVDAATAVNCHELERLAFILGARVGDLPPLRVDGVFLIHSRSLALLLPQTKTSDTIGLRCIHVPLNTWSSNYLETAVKAAVAEQRPYVFLPVSMELSRTDLVKEVSKEERRLRTVNDLRSLRRGGLCTLSLAGHPMSEIVLLSGHLNGGTLNTYLGSGLLNGELMAAHHRMINTTEAALAAGSRLPVITLLADTEDFEMGPMRQKCSAKHSTFQ